MKQVKYKNHIFVNGYAVALDKLANQPIGAAKGFVLGKFIKQVAEKNKIFEEQRIKLVEKHGVKDKKGTYKINKGEEEIVNKEFNELLEIEETYDVEPIGLDDSVNGMTTKELILLEDILVQ